VAWVGHLFAGGGGGYRIWRTRTMDTQTACCYPMDGAKPNKNQFSGRDVRRSPAGALQRERVTLAFVRSPAGADLRQLVRGAAVAHARAVRGRNTGALSSRRERGFSRCPGWDVSLADDVTAAPARLPPSSLRAHFWPR
jgi:hypothetical protein